MNTIKSLDQAVSFPVESTCIRRGILHSHGEESGHTQWIGGGIPVRCGEGVYGEEDCLWRSMSAGLLFPYLVQCLLGCAGFPSVKNYGYPVCISLVRILKTTQSLTFQFSNKVWQSLFCKQVNFIM